MLCFGTNITAHADTLQPVTVEKLYHSLRNPKPRIRQLVDQLRIIQTLDKRSYRMQKKLLPYLVCATFKPPIRRRENFLNTSHFIVDLDGIGMHFDKAALRQKLVSDPQIVLLFTSPGGDGLKVLYQLEQKISDFGLFSAFYKLFVQSLAARFHLHPVIDSSTSDVTRACFISYDENAYYNKDALPVDMNAYINTLEADTLWEVAAEADTALKEAIETKKEARAETRPSGLAVEVMVAIRQKLNPNFRKPSQKQYYVPSEVEEYIKKLGEHLPHYSLQLLESSPINYGRKLKIGTTGAWAEINLFYGKRGFTFIKTTKTGSNSELAELCVQVLEQHLYTANGDI